MLFPVITKLSYPCAPDIQFICFWPFCTNCTILDERKNIQMKIMSNRYIEIFILITEIHIFFHLYFDYLKLKWVWVSVIITVTGKERKKCCKCQLLYLYFFSSVCISLKDWNLNPFPDIWWDQCKIYTICSRLALFNRQTFDNNVIMSRVQVKWSRERGGRVQSQGKKVTLCWYVNWTIGP